MALKPDYKSSAFDRARDIFKDMTKAGHVAVGSFLEQVHKRKRKVEETQIVKLENNKPRLLLPEPELDAALEMLPPMSPTLASGPPTPD